MCSLQTSVQVCGACTMKHESAGSECVSVLHGNTRAQRARSAAAALLAACWTAQSRQQRSATQHLTATSLKNHKKTSCACCVASSRSATVPQRHFPCLAQLCKLTCAGKPFALSRRCSIHTQASLAQAMQSAHVPLRRASPSPCSAARVSAYPTPAECSCGRRAPCRSTAMATANTVPHPVKYLAFLKTRSCGAQCYMHRSRCQARTQAHQVAGRLPMLYHTLA